MVPHLPDSLSPLTGEIYTADPSAHVFNDRVYIYASHDIESNIAEDDFGGHFAMQDYHVLSMETPCAPQATVHPLALHVRDVPWAERQMWAPDAAEKNGRYFLYFPAKTPDGIFQIGVATSDSPTGPFIAEPNPIKGSFSIDPCVFCDDDGQSYLYFGGIWGGQLQRWQHGSFVHDVNSPTDLEPAADQPALCPKVARLTEDMLEFITPPADVLILDEYGCPLLSGDHDRRFFEASWMHKHNGSYYFSYSTGNTHKICYAIGDNPFGPFTYQGVILNPVLGWTNHHSIVCYNNSWFLYFHDASLSGGKTHLRCVKVLPLTHRDDGTIETVG